MLHAPPNKKLDIRFKYSDVRSSSGDCKDNFIEMRNGYSPQSPLLKKICSPNNEIHVISSGNIVLMDMKVTNAGGRWRGIHAVAKYI